MKKRFTFFLALAFISLFLSGCSLSFGFGNKFDTSIYNEPYTVTATKSQEERLLEIGETYVEAMVTVFVVDSSGEEQSFGSGVGIYEGGYIATNYHVIAAAAASSLFSVEVYFNEGEEGFEAEILWSESRLDVAILKCENPNLPFVPMKDRFISPAANDKLKALEVVVAMGTPLSFSLQNTITLGTISSASPRESYADNNVYEDLIQHTAPINPGNSGGALFDSYGYLIGLNTLGALEANSIYFSVPIYPIIVVLDRVVEAYENSQSYSVAKIGISAVDRFLSAYVDVVFTDKGVLVVDSENLLLFADDVIISLVNGEKTYAIDDRNDLLFALLNSNSGDSVTVKIKRNGLTVNVNITLG